MEHYKKGQNIEEEFVKGNLPIPNLPSDFLWMQVTGGSKIHNVLNYAKKALKNKEATHIVWSSSGGGITKAITCAEITKREFKNYYQVTKLCQRKIDEVWDPIIKDLDPIIVTRKIPAIHILLTPDPVDPSILGAQAPNDPDAFWKENSARRIKTIDQTPLNNSNEEAEHNQNKRQCLETEDKNQVKPEKKPRWTKEQRLKRFKKK